MDPNAKLLYSGNWRDELFKSGLRQEYTIDFSGKSKKADYYLSAGYLNDKGVFSIQRFERYSTRASFNYMVNDWLQVGTNISLSHSVREGSASTGTVWFLRTMPSVYPIYERDQTSGDYILDKMADVFTIMGIIVKHGKDGILWLMMFIITLHGHMMMYPTEVILKLHLCRA